MTIKWSDLDIRVIDQRIGMGVGGFDTVVRIYHTPTGILVEMPRINGISQHKQRELAAEMIEYVLVGSERK